jgi:hypothetical protein
MIEPMKRGALARVNNNNTKDLVLIRQNGLDGERLYLKGFEFEVEDYIPDGEVDGKPCAFYWGNANGGVNNVCVLASDVEQAKSAEEMAERELPEPKELLDFIVSALLTDSDGIRVSEVGRSGGVIEAFGKTEDGLAFGFSFPVTEVSIWRTDD